MVLLKIIDPQNAGWTCFWRDQLPECRTNTISMYIHTYRKSGSLLVTCTAWIKHILCLLAIPVLCTINGRLDEPPHAGGLDSRYPSLSNYIVLVISILNRTVKNTELSSTWRIFSLFIWRQRARSAVVKSFPCCSVVTRKDQSTRKSNMQLASSWFTNMAFYTYIHIRIKDLSILHI